MNYISISQAAVKFNVSERYVRKLCTEGMIVGAAKIGKTWIVPEDATIENKPSINVVFSGDNNIGLEVALYLLEKGERVCFISKSEKQILRAVQQFNGNGQYLVHNIDASSEEEMIKVRDSISKYTISKVVYAENNAKFDFVENNTYEDILQNFRGPIYTSIIATSVLYPLMNQTKIIAILHEKASRVGLANETIFSAAYHGMDGYFDSLYKACEDDDKISNILKVYTGAVDSEFWYSDNAKKVFKLPAKKRIPPRELARIAIDTVNNTSTLVVPEIYIRRAK